MAFQFPISDAFPQISEYLKCLSHSYIFPAALHHYLMCHAKHTMGVFKSQFTSLLNRGFYIYGCFVENSCLIRLYTSVLFSNWPFCVVSQNQGRTLR